MNVRNYTKTLGMFGWKLVDIHIFSADPKKENYYQNTINCLIDRIDMFRYQDMSDLFDLINTSISSGLFTVDELTFVKDNYRLIIDDKDAVLKKNGEIVGKIPSDKLLEFNSNNNQKDKLFFLINSADDARNFVKKYLVANYFDIKHHMDDITDALNPYEDTLRESKWTMLKDRDDDAGNREASHALSKYEYNPELDTISEDLVRRYDYVGYMPKYKDPYWDTYTKVSWDDGTLGMKELLYTVNEERLNKWMHNSGVSGNGNNTYYILLDSVKKLDIENEVLDLFDEKKE